MAKKNIKLDIATLEALLDEADKSYDKAHKAFEKHDNSEDMHEAEHWLATIHWLNDKIEKANSD